jgi:uncharacterized protein (TIGR03382 family)
VEVGPTTTTLVLGISEHAVELHRTVHLPMTAVAEGILVVVAVLILTVVLVRRRRPA